MPAIEAPHEDLEERDTLAKSSAHDTATEAAFAPANPHLVLSEEEAAPATEVLVVPPADLSESAISPEDNAQPPQPMHKVACHVVTVETPASKGKVEVQPLPAPIAEVTLKDESKVVPVAAKACEVASEEPAKPKDEADHMELNIPVPEPEAPKPSTEQGDGDSGKPPAELPVPGDEEEPPEEPEKPDTSRESAERRAEKIVPEKLSETQSESPKKGGLLFLEVAHIPSSAEEVANTLKQEACDIVAFEYIGYKDERARHEVGEKYTRLISSERLEEIQQNPDGEAAQEAAALFGSDQNAFKLAVLENLMGSDMRFVLLDIACDNPAYTLYAIATRTTEELYKASAAHLPNDRLRDMLYVDLHTWSNSNTAREAYVTTQVKELRQQYPNAKVGVVKGVTHTSVSHAFAAEEQIERRFILSESSLQKHPTEKVRYPYMEQLQRQLHFFPERKLNEKLLDRALLEHLFAQHAQKEEKSLSLKVKNALAVIDPLSDDEVAAVLEQIDAIKWHPPKIFGWSRTETKLEQFFTKLIES